MLLYKLRAALVYCSRIKRLRLEARSLHSRGRMVRERTSKTGIRAAERTNGQTGNETTGNKCASSCGTVLQLPKRCQFFVDLFRGVHLLAILDALTRQISRQPAVYCVWSILKWNKYKERRRGRKRGRE